MSKKRENCHEIAPWLLLTAAAVLMRVPDLFLPVNRDSGLFAYGGWRILHGALPYVDFWDNKLPGVFYINALAIRLFGPAPAALVLFQMIYAVLTAWAFYAVARALCSPRAALISGLIFVFYQGCYGLVDEGNYTESYIALPVLVAVLLILSWSRNHKEFITLFAAGVLGATAALIKQPAASVIIAAMCFAAASAPRRRGLVAAGLVAVGAASMVGATIAWMAANGILRQAFEANIIFNRLYLIDAYTDGLAAAKWNLIAGINLVALPLAGAIAGVASGQMRRTRITGLEWLLVPWFVLDLVGLAMGGRFYNHYFVAILISSMLLLGLYIDSIRTRKLAFTSAVVALALFLGPIWSFEKSTPSEHGLGIYSAAEREYYALRWIVTRRIAKRVTSPTEQVASWVRTRTSPSDTIYVWGWDTRIAFLAQRTIPSRYLHTHPLGATGFNREARIRELACDLELNRPKFIVDVSLALPTTAPPLSGKAPSSTCAFFRLDCYEPVQNVVARYYSHAAVVAGYTIYELKP